MPFTKTLCDKTKLFTGIGHICTVQWLLPHVGWELLRHLRTTTLQIIKTVNLFHTAIMQAPRYDIGLRRYNKRKRTQYIMSQYY